MLSATQLTPIVLIPGSASCPMTAFLFMGLCDEPDQEADSAEKQTSSKKALSQLDQLPHLALLKLPC